MRKFQVEFTESGYRDPDCVLERMNILNEVIQAQENILKHHELFTT